MEDLRSEKAILYQSRSIHPKKGHKLEDLRSKKAILYPRIATRHVLLVCLDEMIMLEVNKLSRELYSYRIMLLHISQTSFRRCLKSVSANELECRRDVLIGYFLQLAQFSETNDNRCNAVPCRVLRKEEAA